MNKNKIEITGNMDLGAYSPLELAEEQQLNEISNQLVGSALRSAKDRRRERQFDNIMAEQLYKINNEKSFSVPCDGKVYEFRLCYANNSNFAIAAIIKNEAGSDRTVKILDINHIHFTLNKEDITETPLGYVIDNLKAGPRMKLNNLISAGREMNTALTNTQKQVSESKIREMIREGLNELSKKQDNVYTMADWRRDRTLKVKDGQLIAPEVYYQLRNCVPPMSDGLIFQVGEAYDSDPMTGKDLYWTFKHEGDDYYRYIGLYPYPYRAKIKECTQKRLVDVMKRYTEGKATAKEANKAIMDLADSSVKDKKINESNMEEDTHTVGILIGDVQDKNDLIQNIILELQNKGFDLDGDSWEMFDNRDAYVPFKTLKNNNEILKLFNYFGSHLVVDNSTWSNIKLLQNYLSKNSVLNESYAKDGNYTHFAVNKATNKIVNGWDYSDYDNEELRQFAKDYFFNDLIDYELDPKQYTILTVNGCKRRGIDPFDDTQWANE